MNVVVLWHKEGVSDLNTIIVSVGTVTYAMKARKLLLKNGIQSKLIKSDSSDNGTGCTHGIEISNKDYFEAVRILGEGGIKYSVPPSRIDILR